MKLLPILAAVCGFVVGVIVARSWYSQKFDDALASQGPRYVAMAQ